MNFASAFWDIGLYAIGLAAIMLIYLPFSPMTIDLVNFSRDTQIAIYRRRHLLWAIGGLCLGAVLLRGLIGMLGANGVLDAGSRLTGSLASPHTAWFWITLVTIGFLVLLFWSGYVPYVMTPPSRQRILAAAEADKLLGPDDTVLGLVHGNEVRAYPRDAIARPHYFTDTVGNTPLLISYCILCNSGIAFKSELDGRTLDLKCVTAYNNNIIYYEPAAGNFIQQLDGRVIHGPDVGKSLVAYPVVLSTWSAWKQLHPETKLYYAPPITLRDKMVARMLQTLIPISKLSKRSKPWHRIRGELDNRLPAMSLVIGVEINDDSCVYPVEVLRRNPVLSDTVGGEPIVVLYDTEHDVGEVFSRKIDSGSALTFLAATKEGTAVVACDQETGTLWTAAGRGNEGPLSGRALAPIAHFNKLFWFGWVLFKPRTRVSATAS
ncbi:MAG: DUF3179 domain-containing protein [Betaproteobacteria bacterium]|nr:DUF3179 domain-containing protein [Betaproteobacteria bacterium]